MGFAITANFHPTLTANGQLDEVQAWFARVFRRPCHGPSSAYLIEGYNNDYCFTVMLQEVFFDVMDPSQFSSANNPQPSAGPRRSSACKPSISTTLGPLSTRPPQKGCGCAISRGK